MRNVRPRTAELIEAGSLQGRLLATSFYGSEITLTDLPLTDWNLDWERGRDVPGSGAITTVYADDLGKSITPRTFTDYLAPFGQELQIDVEVSAGSYAERIPLNRFRISSTPEARDANLRLGSRVITTSSEVRLTLLDPLQKVLKWGFSSPSKAPAGATCWSELARLTGMQVVRTMPDQSMPSVEYELAQGGRLKACQQIAARLGGTLYVRSDGALVVLPNTPSTPVKRITLGEDSLQLDEIARQLTSEGLYNEVVGNFEDANGDPINIAPARITDGALAVNGPLGTITRYYSSEFVRNVTQARSALQSILQQSSVLKTVIVPQRISFDPRLEIGDTVELEQASETLTGTIESIKMSHSLDMDLSIAVTAAIPEMNLGSDYAPLS